MSCKESPHVGASTTTVSSVAVHAGDSKIVIAVVKVNSQLAFLCVAGGLLAEWLRAREDNAEQMTNNK
jgi:hypothetical protein